MARTSRNDSSKEANKKRKVWYYAKYLRKSSEEDDSRSIKNQDAALEEYLERMKDREPDSEFICVRTFQDEDDTGTDSNRADFQALLKQLGNPINMLIVTDSSRLSRDTSESLFYIQKLFVTLDIRFISMQLPALDSYLEPEKIYSIEVPIQSMFNEKHAQDTSEKIRRTFDMKRRQGQFIGAFAPYGYKKNPDNKNHLIIDDEAAQTVRDIFDWYLEGMSKRGIAHRLNELGVKCPGAYKRANGSKYQNSGMKFGNPLWSEFTILTLLKNQVYIGDLVQGRYKIKSYKVHTQIRMPEEQWFISEGTHEAIIDKETYQKAQDQLKKDTRSSPGKRTVYLFSGFLKCMDCEHSVIRKPNSSGLVYYYCSTYKNRSRKACTPHSIRHDKLEAAILDAIQKRIAISLNMAEAIEAINNAPDINRKSQSLTEAIKSKERELEKAQRYLKGIVQAMIDGDISKEEYRSMRFDYEEQIRDLDDTLKRLNAEKKSFEEGVSTENPFLTNFKKYRNITQLNREILLDLVEKVYIGEGNEICIHFKFADEYRIAADFIDQNKDKLS